MIIVGSGHVAHLLADKIEKHPEYGLRVVGFVDRDDRVASGNGKTALIGTTDDLPRLVREHGPTAWPSRSPPTRTTRRSA